MKKLKRIFGILIRTFLVIVSIIIFPLGLFLLGYLIGSRAKKQDFKISTKNEGKIEEKIPITEESQEESDRVVLDE